jgi:hypothetical protein
VLSLDHGLASCRCQSSNENKQDRERENELHGDVKTERLSKKRWCEPNLRKRIAMDFSLDETTYLSWESLSTPAYVGFATPTKLGNALGKVFSHSQDTLLHPVLKLVMTCPKVRNTSKTRRTKLLYF